MATQGVTLDKVSIEIHSSSEQASKDIDKLAVSLSALKSAIKGGFNGLNKLSVSLKDLASSSKDMGEIATNISKLEEVTTTLQELSNIPTPTGFKGIVKGLGELKKTTDGLGDFDKKLEVLPDVATNLSSLSTIPKATSVGTLAKNLEGLVAVAPKLDTISEKLKTIPEMVEPLKALQGISIGKGFGNAISNLERLPDAMSKFDASTLENITRVSNQLSDALTPVANKFRDVADGASKLSEMSNKYGIGITKIREYSKSTTPILGRLKKGLTDVSKNILNLGKGALTSIGGHTVRSFQKAASKAKQLTLALIGTRTIFTLTRKAVSEYLALDTELSKFSTNVWRALGAQLAPAIEYAMELFKQFVRVVYSFVYAITGIDLIARANAKAMDKWSKSAKDALGNLQKFDDLNVVEFPKSAGEGPDLIDMDKIDLTPIQWLVDLIKELKEAIQEAFDTGEWKGVGNVIAKIINTAFNKINVDTLRKKLFSVADDFGDAINGFVENIDMYSIMRKLSDVIITVMQSIDKFVKKINWRAVGKAISDGLEGIRLGDTIVGLLNITESVLIGFEQAFTQIKWNIIGKKLSNTITNSLSKLNEILLNINWSTLGNSIRDFILNINWVEIFTQIIDLFKNTLSSTGSLLDGIFGTTIFSDLAETVNNVIDMVETLGETIVTQLGEDSAAGAVIGLIETIFKSIKEMTEKAGKIISEWVVTPEFQTTIDTVDEIITNISDTLSTMVKDWGNWYNSEGSEEFKTILDTLTRIANKILPEIQKLIEKLRPVIEWLFKHIILPLSGQALKNVEKVLETLELIIDFLKLSFSVDFNNIIGSLLSGNKTKIINAINEIKKNLNNLIEDINRLFGKNLIKFRFKYTLDENGGGGFRGYASGGYPEKGQYFYARENGIPEMVGSIGSQTAVANNMQIVQGIKQGVKEAIQEADFNFTNVVNVGNETLYKGQQSYNKLQNNKYGTINV